MNALPGMNWLIVGATKSGKTTFLAKCLTKEYLSFSTEFTSIHIFCDKVSINAWKKHSENFYLPTTFYDSDFRSAIEECPPYSILIYDDLIVTLEKDKELSATFQNAFKLYANHKNQCNVLISQNVYSKGKYNIMNMTKEQSKVITFFKGPTDVSERNQSLIKQITDNKKMTDSLCLFINTVQPQKKFATPVTIKYSDANNGHVLVFIGFAEAVTYTP